ncbi:hypothetical protein SAMN05421830_102310 [Desulfomicrobium norvegicum]|uniref:Uncharacterized protein n=1 Tax=Desulfomicrobium norvegicum (strain DSM 1741 / NCIMB 8310) TaxID=52561 RepID=A0A8G2C1A8_DESNO|nr:hypothetical protein SAMN05421830_102310 [Desulfomicrobium norvegicum]
MYIFKGIYKLIRSLCDALILKRIRAVSVPICSTRETLDECLRLVELEQSGAYLRFGDGDVCIADGEGDLLQEKNSQMTLEMIEAFSASGPGILKTLPLNSSRFGMEYGMRPGVHLGADERCDFFLVRCFPYFLGNKIYNTCALHHQAVVDTEYCIDFLRLLRAKTILFVGCCDVPDNVKMLLFGTAFHVKTPASDSYKDIDRICFESSSFLEESSSFGVVVVAMGCAGRIFINRMLRFSFNVFYFDFGSLLDALCQRETRAWISETSVMDKSTYILKRLSE